MNVSLPQLIQILQNDPSLSVNEKQEVVSFIKKPSFLEKIDEGIFGAGAALLLSKFMKMSPRAQILMTIAGYGIGKFILDLSNKKDRFLTYNNKMKVYEVK